MRHVDAPNDSNVAPAYGNEYPAASYDNSTAEKGTSIPMQPVANPGNQEYYAAPAPPYPQQKTQMPAEPQTQQPSRVQSPVSSAYPSEMGMGSHGEFHEAPPQRY